MRRVCALISSLPFILATIKNNATCVDKSPYCNKNDCVVRPGYAIEYCQKTCGDCKGHCQESIYVSCNNTSKSECANMLKDYCPILCGLCRVPYKKKEIKVKTEPLKVSPPSKNVSAHLMSVEKSIEPIFIEEITKADSPKIEKLENVMPNNTEFFDGLDDSESFVYMHPTDPYPSALLPSDDPKIRFRDSNRDFYMFPRRNYLPKSSYQPSRPSIDSFYDPYRKEGSEERPEKPFYQKKHYLGSRRRPSNYVYGFPKETEILDPHVYVPNLPIEDDEYRLPNYSPLKGNKKLRNILPYEDYKVPDHLRLFQRPRLPSLPSETGDSDSMLDRSKSLPYSKPNTQEMEELEEDTQRMGKPKVEPKVLPPAVEIADLIALLGCQEKDPVICSQVTEESCLARPGYYLKLCPVKCQNCNGLLCIDSNKLDCEEVRRRNGCRLPAASEYCPKACEKCHTPSYIAEQQSVCKDELETCEQLVESGACHHPYSMNTLRNYCAKSCGFCKTSQFYMNDGMNWMRPRSRPISRFP